MKDIQTYYIILAGLINFLGVLIVTGINLNSNKKHSFKKSLDALFDEKVNKTVCDPAMRRIGSQIDEIKDVNKNQALCIRGLENGMSFMVGKMGGNYDQIKNTGLNLG